MPAGLERMLPNCVVYERQLRFCAQSDWIGWDSRLMSLISRVEVCPVLLR